jgi:hypothetical protein
MKALLTPRAAKKSPTPAMYKLTDGISMTSPIIKEIIFICRSLLRPTNYPNKVRQRNPTATPKNITAIKESNPNLSEGHL